MKNNEIFKSLKTLSATTLLVSVVIYAILATIGWLYYAEDSAEKSAELLLKQEAVEAVDSYVEKTADTGEMDEFVQSEEGQTFYSCIK